MKRTGTWIGLVVISAALFTACQEQKAPEPSKQQAQDSTSQPQQNDKSFAIRGVIEGFYGTPWTQKQRMDMFDFMGKHHFNTYVYAPKDDPYQRLRWMELYPATQGEQMKELITGAKQDGIRFIYSISPGLPEPLPGETITPPVEKAAITYSSPEQRKQLLEKIDQMMRLGAEGIMLSFDDIQQKLNQADQQVYGGDYAHAQMELANYVLETEREKNPNFQLWFAPTTYYGVKDNAYWQTLRSQLDASVQVIWTGSWILAPSITSEQADNVAKLLGRKPLIWDNYPVNDYTYSVKKRPQLFMGPLEFRAPDLYAHSTGLLANPMIQPEASKIALATVGDYLDHPETYDPANAWQESLQAIGGEGLRKFSEYAMESSLHKENNASFAKLVAGNDKEKLRQELELLRDLPKQVAAELAGKPLLQELEPWLSKLGKEGEAGVLALQVLSDPKRADLKKQLTAKIQELQKDNLKIGEDVFEFANHALQSK
ncbi:MAG: protein O-GlcNAcase [Tumebacillaceae bacterium]